MLNCSKVEFKDWEFVKLFVLSLTYVTYFTSRVLQESIRVLALFITKNDSKKFSQILGIQAGSKGFELVFFHELVASAENDFGVDEIKIHSVSKNRSYLLQIHNFLKKNKPKYLILDPRTLSGSGVVAFCQSLFSSLLMAFKGITPIVFLTDASVIKWRLQSVIWTASRGKCLMLMEPKLLGKLLPHSRNYGPIFIPITKSPRNFEKKFKNKKSEDFKIGFKGSIYPEREKYIKELLNCCNNLNIKVTIEDKNFNGDNDGYWEFMYKHDIIFTTTNQTNIDKNWVDNLDINQLVFRISEALSLDKVLVTTSVDGLEKFFEPEYDFIELKEDLSLEKAFEISIKESLKLAIMKQSGVSGNYDKLIKNKCFWRILDMPEVGDCYESNCRCLNKA